MYMVWEVPCVARGPEVGVVLRINLITRIHVPGKFIKLHYQKLHITTTSFRTARDDN